MTTETERMVIEALREVVTNGYYADDVSDDWTISGAVYAIATDALFAAEIEAQSGGERTGGSLVTRLRQYGGRQWETTACYNGLRDEAADTIERLTRELAEAKESAIAAYRQSLEDAGMVVVPKEPTEAMLKAAWDSGWAATMTEDDDFSRWYRAMVAAAAPPSDAK